MAIEFPGEADAAVHLHHLAARKLESVGGADASATSGDAELRGIVSKCPGTVVAIRAGQLDLHVEIGHTVFQSLEGSDGSAERVAPEGEFSCQLEGSLRAADLFERHQDR